MDWTANFEEVWAVSVLPSSSSPWEQALDLTDADLVARDPVGLILAARSDAEAPLALLPYLAAERSVDEYSSAWPEARQRAVTAASFTVHRVKGTRPALDLALAPLGYANKVVEWFEVEPRRRPYTFRVRLTLPDDSWGRAQRGEIVRVANAAKNAHTKLEALELERGTPPATVHVGGAARRIRRIRIAQLPKPTTVRADACGWVGTHYRIRRTIRAIVRAN